MSMPGGAEYTVILFILLAIVGLAIFLIGAYFLIMLSVKNALKNQLDEINLTLRKIEALQKNNDSNPT